MVLLDSRSAVFAFHNGPLPIFPLGCSSLHEMRSGTCALQLNSAAVAVKMPPLARIITSLHGRVAVPHQRIMPGLQDLQRRTMCGQATRPRSNFQNAILLPEHRAYRRAFGVPLPSSRPARPNARTAKHQDLSMRDGYSWLHCMASPCDWVPALSDVSLPVFSRIDPRSLSLHGVAQP